MTIKILKNIFNLFKEFFFLLDKSLLTSNQNFGFYQSIAILFNIELKYQTQLSSHEFIKFYKHLTVFVKILLVDFSQTQLLKFKQYFKLENIVFNLNYIYLYIIPANFKNMKQIKTLLKDKDFDNIQNLLLECGFNLFLIL